MRELIVVVGLAAAVFLSVPGAGADVQDRSAAGAAKTHPVAKPVKVYNPAANFTQFSSDLALTPEQQKEIRPVLNDLEKQLLPLRKLTFQRLGQRGAPIVQEHYQRIRERLDQPQVEKFDGMVARGEITPFTR